jgi:hypothetical protein
MQARRRAHLEHCIILHHEKILIRRNLRENHPPSRNHFSSNGRRQSLINFIHEQPAPEWAEGEDSETMRQGDLETQKKTEN